MCNLVYQLADAFAYVTTAQHARDVCADSLNRQGDLVQLRLGRHPSGAVANRPVTPRLSINTRLHFEFSYLKWKS